MKKLFACLVILSLLFCISGCDPLSGFGNGDWEYPLPNGYSIWRINSRDIVCMKLESESGGARILDRFVVAFCHDDRYVGLRCVDVPEDTHMEIDISNPDDYLLDTLTGQLSGPMGAEEFPLALTWLATRPAPDGADFS